VNLRNRQYCIFNEQKTPEEYRAFLRTFHGQSWREREEMRLRFSKEVLKHPRPHATFHLSENCTGNYITESRNVHESSFIVEGENLKYCFYLVEQVNDCMDFSLTGRTAELIYESCTCVINVSRLRFCMQCRNGCNELFYCYGCDACQNCFGCSGLYRKQYCIFNMQYTKEDYERLVPMIIEHMRSTSEWGEFFPETLSPMPYNRTLAQRYFPLSKEEALKRGYLWEEDDLKEFPNAIDARDLPDRYPRQQEAIVVRSQSSGRPFRITKQEIEKYQDLGVPLPRLTYEERMDNRARLLGGIQLYERACAKTGKKVVSTYPPDSPYIIWDRDAYINEFQ
jgi:hypothetical protein